MISMFEKHDIVNVTAKKNDDFDNDFTGIVVGIKDNNGKVLISVKDAEDDVWDCDEDQLELAYEDEDEDDHS